VPSFAARLDGAKQEAPFLGGAVPGWFRTPYGDGDALVGDAGYNKDPITAQGITDAFHDAERCSQAIDAWLGGGKSFEDAMSTWHQERDAQAMPMYEFTSHTATLQPPATEMQQLLGAIHGDQEAMDGFVSVISGAVSPAEFFAAENVERMLFATQRPA
jgi:2-polyprenyl-6-methoxyphenol hydroxylase-like FAD-dependent oxidoreductase